jgi:hypothetical protein
MTNTIRGRQLKALDRQEGASFYYSSSPQFEAIRKILIVPDEFTVAGGEITPTLKLKRRISVSEVQAADRRALPGSSSGKDPAGRLRSDISSTMREPYPACCALNNFSRLAVGLNQSTIVPLFQSQRRFCLQSKEVRESCQDKAIGAP